MSDITKWNPFKELADIFNIDSISSLGSSSSSNIFKFDKGFKMDIWEDDESIQIKSELPGINKDDITIDLNDEILTISANYKEEKIEQPPTRKYFLKEITNKSFTRQLRIPDCEPDKIEASHINGVLNIKIPKKQDAKTQVKKIDIK